MTGDALDTILKFLSLVLSASMAGKLFATGLHKQYPVFFLYFLFRVPNSIWPLFLPTNSVWYLHFWTATYPLNALLYILLVVELYRLVLKNYPGLNTVGRWAMLASVAISTTISVLSLLPKITPAMPQRTRVLNYLLVMGRGIDTALAIFIVVLLLFLSRYPIELNRNTRLHALIYSVFFLSSTVLFLLRSLFGLRAADTVNTVLSAVNVCSIAGWLLFFNPAGEKIEGLQRKLDRDREERLLFQLDALNTTLARASRQRIG